jgi:hypothetical protein
MMHQSSSVTTHNAACQPVSTQQKSWSMLRQPLIGQRPSRTTGYKGFNKRPRRAAHTSLHKVLGLLSCTAAAASYSYSCFK